MNSLCLLALASPKSGAALKAHFMIITQVLVNSSWTCGHIAWLWRLSPAPIVLYPPCGVQDFMDPAEGFNGGSDSASLSNGKAAKVTSNSSKCSHGSNSSSSDGSSSKREDFVKKCSSTTVRHIVSVGQFRPEKDHPLQLHAFALLLQELKPEEGDVRGPVSRQDFCRIPAFKVTVIIFSSVSFF